MPKCAWCEKEGKLSMGQKHACNDHKKLLIDEYNRYVAEQRRKKKDKDRK